VYHFLERPFVVSGRQGDAGVSADVGQSRGPLERAGNENAPADMRGIYHEKVGVITHREKGPGPRRAARTALKALPDPEILDVRSMLMPSMGRQSRTSSRPLFRPLALLSLEVRLS
jgi:hypothetical protein